MKESYINKTGDEKTYTRTKRVDKFLPVKDISSLFKIQGITYLKHRTHVDNDKASWPLIRASLPDIPNIHLDFSENIAMKPKFEAQDAHFSGKQYSLHCMLLDPPNPYKYIFHLSNSTIHDYAIVDLVLRDVFDLQKWKNNTVIIKSDNCQEQYKDLNAFGSYQKLADDYNTKILRVYGAAGHGRGLIDAMSSFGVKSILRRNIVGKDVFFSNATENFFKPWAIIECCIERLVKLIIL